MVDVTKIEKLLKKHFYIQGTKSVDPTTGVVDVEGEVVLKEKFKISRLPVQFGVVNGTFACWKNTLTTLEGAPHTADYFICEYNQLTSLAHAPKKVSHSFRCGYNQLTSLAHAPKAVKNFECPSNLLTSLEGAPTQVEVVFDCSNNKLTSLQHCPTSVGYEFNCSGNQLTSLAHGPQDVGASGGPFGGHYLCSHNQLSSLVGAPSHVSGRFSCHENPLKTLEGVPDTIGKVFTLSYAPDLPMLRLLNYKRLYIEDGPLPLVEIIHKYAGQGIAGSFSCAHELELAGFKDNAAW